MHPSKMTAQQIYNTVRNHLLTQNRKSVYDSNNINCFYRGPNGTKCAIGCLISDSEYSTELEGRNIYSLKNTFTWMIEHEQLLTDLQYVHDSIPVDTWKVELDKVANRYGLSITKETEMKIEIGKTYKTESGSKLYVVGYNLDKTRFVVQYVESRVVSLRYLDGRYYPNGDVTNDDLIEEVKPVRYLPIVKHRYAANAYIAHYSFASKELAERTGKACGEDFVKVIEV